MSSIISQDVDAEKLLPEAAQKAAVRPVAEMNWESLRGEVPAVRIDVHAMDAGRGLGGKDGGVARFWIGDAPAAACNSLQKRPAATLRPTRVRLADCCGSLSQAHRTGDAPEGSLQLLAQTVPAPKSADQFLRGRGV